MRTSTNNTVIFFLVYFVCLVVSNNTKWAAQSELCKKKNSFHAA